MHQQVIKCLKIKNTYSKITYITLLNTHVLTTTVLKEDYKMGRNLYLSVGKLLCVRMCVCVCIYTQVSLTVLEHVRELYIQWTFKFGDLIRPAPIMLKILPIILSRISQKFCPLFFWSLYYLLFS